MAGKSVTDVESFLQTLDPKTRAIVDPLRATVLAAHEGLVEEIKWNAPSYSHQGQDRVTLGLERKGGVRVVLHRGAKLQDVTAFVFSDPTGRAKWPAPDRGVLTFADEAEVRRGATDLCDLVARWIDATRIDDSAIS